MPRSVLASTSLGWIFSAASYHSAASWNRPASKYMFPSCTRVTASVGFCWAVVFMAVARDSSSAGVVWGLPPPPDAWLDAELGAAGGPGRVAPCCLPYIQPTVTPENPPATPTTTESLSACNQHH